MLERPHAPTALVVASASAFLLSELADLVIYTPLQRRGLIRAVLLSSMAGLVVDSIMFLWLAFGSFNFLAGQFIGKAWMVLVAMPIVAFLRNRDRRAGAQASPTG
jgi:queuosine precursor transporter